MLCAIDGSCDIELSQQSGNIYIHLVIDHFIITVLVTSCSTQHITVYHNRHMTQNKFLI